MTTKETGPKAAFQSRRWVAFFIRPALVCLEAGNLGMTTDVTTKQKDPKATQKSRPWAAFFKWPALVCLGICNPGMTANKTVPKATF